MRSNALSTFERNCGRTQRHTVECRSSQPMSRAIALAGPKSPSLSAKRCGGYLWSNVECTFERMHQCIRMHNLRSNAGP
jgi:hypothetical protein